MSTHEIWRERRCQLFCILLTGARQSTNAERKCWYYPSSAHCVLFVYGCCFVFRASQIPESCPEHHAAVAQLARDGGTEKLSALEFEVRRSDADGVCTAEGGVNDKNIAADTSASASRAEFGVSPFFTPCGPRKVLGPQHSELDFSVKATTTSNNLYRVLRALQVNRIS